MAEIEIAREPYGSPLSRPLTDAQAEELVERYGGWEGAGSEPEPELFEDPDGYFLVARLDGSPVGCAGICRCEGERTAELRRMYVAPETRRLGIARTLVTRPRLLLLDEPFGALDQQTRLLMGDELLDLWRLTDATVFLITHSLDEAALLSDRIGVMSARPGVFIDLVDTAWPRERDSRIVSDPAFGRVTGRLWEMLRGQSLKALAGG